ncbi:MAG: hypothetical protein E6Q97_25105, partial [Desulfurellales bacterium]
MPTFEQLGIKLIADTSQWTPGIAGAIKDSEKLDTEFSKLEKASSKVDDALDDVGSSARKNADAFGELKD